MDMQPRGCRCARMPARAPPSRHAPSDDILGLRLACLDDQARQLGRWSTSSPREEGVDLAQAVDGVEALPAVDACGDSAALRKRAPSPLRLDVRRQVEAIREDLRRGMSLSRTGDYRGASGLEGALLDPARATGYRVVEAEVALEVGETKLKLGELPLGEDLLREAVEAAEAGNDDVTKARALIALTATLAERDSLLVEALRTGALASAVLEHLPEQVELRAELDDALAAIDHREGRYADALARARQGLELRESAYGPGDERVAASLASCGRRAHNMGDLAQGLEFSRAALADIRAHASALGTRSWCPYCAPWRWARWPWTISRGRSATSAGRRVWRSTRSARTIPACRPSAGSPQTSSWSSITPARRSRWRSAPKSEAGEAAPARHRPFIDVLSTIGGAYIELESFRRGAGPARGDHDTLCASSSNPAFEAIIIEEMQGKALLGKGRVREAIARLQRSLAMRESSESAADPDIAEARFFLGLRSPRERGATGRNARGAGRARARAGYAEASRSARARGGRDVAFPPHGVERIR